MLVARYGGTPQLAERVEAAVRSQQNSDVAVAMGQAAAAILERVVVQVGTQGCVASRWTVQALEFWQLWEACAAWGPRNRRGPGSGPAGQRGSWHAEARQRVAPC